MNLPGKRIAGAERAAKYLHDSTEGKRKASFGKRVTGSKAPPPPPSGSYSVAQVVDALKVNPARVDELLAAELRRPEGPRKNALRALKVAEEGRPEGGRPELLARLEKTLTPPPAEPAAASTGGSDGEPRT